MSEFERIQGYLPASGSFAGSGTWRRAFVKMKGYRWKRHIHDKLINHRMDMANMSYANVLKKLIHLGLFDALHFGLECRTMTRLANPPYRDGGNVWGLPSVLGDSVKGPICLEANHFICNIAYVMNTAAVSACFVLTSVENGWSTYLRPNPKMKTDVLLFIRDEKAAVDTFAGKHAANQVHEVVGKELWQAKTHYCGW